MDIGEEMDTFLRKNVLGTNFKDKKVLADITKKMKKFVGTLFPKKFFHTFVETYVVEDTFHAFVGFRKLNAPKFSGINCQIGAEQQ
jgi:hypothetical protein